MQKILSIEDAKDFQLYLSSVLKDYNVTHVDTFKEAIGIINTGVEHFDLVLIDLSLTDGNGINIVSKLKESSVYQNTPVVILSGDCNILTKVAAFGIGADDYITKPPDRHELKARIAARLRASQNMDRIKTIIELGNLRVDTERMCVELNEAGKKQRVNLTPLEYQILVFLIKKPGVVFSREQIIESVWGVGTYITERTVDAHISHLRSKISKSNLLIQTALNFGYKIELLKN